jgi:hypothetical protein
MGHGQQPRIQKIVDKITLSKHRVAFDWVIFVLSSVLEHCSVISLGKQTLRSWAWKLATGPMKIFV